MKFHNSSLLLNMKHIYTNMKFNFKFNYYFLHCIDNISYDRDRESYV